MHHTVHVHRKKCEAIYKQSRKGKNACFPLWPNFAYHIKGKAFLCGILSCWLQRIQVLPHVLLHVMQGTRTRPARSTFCGCWPILEVCESPAAAADDDGGGGGAAGIEVGGARKRVKPGHLCNAT
eukprot:932124-Pelagomonas_calceolata.AAC.1